MSTPLHQSGNRGEQQVVLAAELDKLRQSGHGAVVILNFANHTGWLATCHARQIDCSLGVASTLQHTTFASTKRKHVSGAGKCLVANGAIGECANGECAVSSRNASACAFEQIDRHGECGAMALGVVVNHHRQTQIVTTLTCKRGHHHTRCVANDERQLLGCYVFCSHDEVAFVFAIFVVDEHDHVAAGNGRNHVVNCGERAVCCLGHAGLLWGSITTSTSSPSCWVEIVRPRHTSASVAAVSPANAGTASPPPMIAGAM